MASEVSKEQLEGVRSALKAARLPEYSEQILMKFGGYCHKYDLSPKELTTYIESFTLSNANVSLGLESLGRLEKFILQCSSKSRVVVKAEEKDSRPPLAKRSSSAMSAESPDQSKRHSSLGFTPIPHAVAASGTPYQSPSKSLQGSPASFSVAYQARKESGQVVVNYNDTLADRGKFVRSPSGHLGLRCRITSNDEEFENLSERYRFMFTPLWERGRALDKHLHRIQKDICEKLHLPESSLTPVGQPSPETVWVVGRIVCESSVGKINAASVLIEGSAKLGGKRTQLDVSNLPEYSLFPGQIVAVEGKNPTGRRMIARQIVLGCKRPFVSTPPQKLLEYHHSPQLQASAPLQIFVASGPFTCSDSLSYEPLQDLLTKIVRSKPDVVILTGPFVDSNHKSLAEGNVILDINDDEGNKVGEYTASYEDVFFQKIIRDELEMLFASEENIGEVSTQFILVPSLNDCHHDCVYPQPPFKNYVEVRREEASLDKERVEIPYCSERDPKRRVRLMPNPCMFRVNEVLIGVGTNDTMFSLSADNETSANITGANRLSRLAAHTLEQQSFSPQFPVPVTSLAQLDFRHIKYWEMDHSPDVLILPSRIMPLAKDVLDTVVVNPGSLAKGNSGGTYAELTVHPMKESDIRQALVAGQERIAHGVKDRIKVHITKI